MPMHNWLSFTPLPHNLLADAACRRPYNAHFFQNNFSATMIPMSPDGYLFLRKNIVKKLLRTPKSSPKSANAHYQSVINHYFQETK